MMKKLFWCSIALLTFFTYSASAQTGKEKTGALLWEITDNGLKQPSYIFGTHHLFPLSFLDSVSGVKRVFASSKQMVGEILLGDMATLAAELSAAGMMPQDTTWQMLLSDDDYQLVDKQLTAMFGTGLQSFGVMKPSMVNTAYTAMLYRKMYPNLRQDEAFDLWFQQQAAERGIEVIGLETVKDQTYALLDATSLKQQAADLVCILKNSEYVEQNSKKLNAMYRAADLKGMEALMLSDDICPMSAEQQIALVDARNQRWLQKLPSIMAAKPSFIAVGCMHLVGKKGLLVGLQKLGYKVKPVLK